MLNIYAQIHKIYITTIWLLLTTPQVKLEELTNKVEEITKKAECLAGHCHLKDSIIFTLASQIRAILRYGAKTNTYT